MANELLPLNETDKKVSEFMDKLAELSRSMGIYVGGCGCCGSPFLDIDGIDSDIRFEDIVIRDDGWRIDIVDESDKENGWHGFKLTNQGKTQSW